MLAMILLEQMKLAYFSSAEGPLTTPASIEGSCPFLWIPYGGFCYFLETVATDSWLEANIQCVQRQVNIFRARVRNRQYS